MPPPPLPVSLPPELEEKHHTEEEFSVKVSILKQFFHRWPSHCRQVFWVKIIFHILQITPQLSSMIPWYVELIDTSMEFLIKDA